MRFFTRLWPYILRYRFRMSVGLLALAAASCASIMAPYVLGRAVDGLREDVTNQKLLEALKAFAEKRKPVFTGE